MRVDSAVPAPSSAGRVPPADPIPAAWRAPSSGPWTTTSDVVIALAFFFLSPIGRPEAAGGPASGVAPALYFLLAVACALVMVVRRHSPLLFVVVAGICLSAHLVVFVDFSIFFVVTGVIAVETTQSRLEAPGRWVGLVLELVGAAVAATRALELIGDQVHAGSGRLILLANAWLLVSVAAFVGSARRRSRDRYNQAFERAAVLEAQQATERRLAVIETQQRIARDVHDLLGHSLTVIAMQAEGARAILATDPAAADEALAVIGETSRRSVDEVRSLVDMLRSDVGGGAADDVDTGADPDDRTSSDSDTGSGATGSTVDAEIGALAGNGVAASGHEDRLELLREPVRQAQRAGLPVTLETDPTDRIPAATAQVLHRVVQESLTNVLRHAPGADTRVLLRTEMGCVALVVENTPAPHLPGPQESDAHVGDGEDGPVHRGFGLIGMRDRVTDLGGSFTAGHTPEGGWRVRAELPASPK